MRATRWTRFAHRAIACSVAAGVVAAALPFVHSRPDAVTLRLAAADLRSRAAESALLARTWDEHRATEAFTREQAAQLSHRVSSTRREAQDAPGELSAVVTSEADTLLLALRDLEALPAPDPASPRSMALAAVSTRLLAIERRLSSAE